MAYERVEDKIEARHHASMTMKGKSQPVEVYEVLGLSRLEAKFHTSFTTQDLSTRTSQRTGSLLTR